MTRSTGENPARAKTARRSHQTGLVAPNVQSQLLPPPPRRRWFSWTARVHFPRPIAREGPSCAFRFPRTRASPRTRRKAFPSVSTETRHRRLPPRASHTLLARAPLRDDADSASRSSHAASSRRLPAVVVRASPRAVQGRRDSSRPAGLPEPRLRFLSQRRLSQRGLGREREEESRGRRRGEDRAIARVPSLPVVLRVVPRGAARRGAARGWRGAVRGWRAKDPFCQPRDCTCLLYTSPSPRDATLSRMPSSA